ncbi:MAG: CopG family transcriptional regulator [Archaeoglobaceae archaeon]
MRRITVSLDEDTSSMLEALSNSDGTTSETIRWAIAKCYGFKKKTNISPEVIENIAELLSEREHIIVDTALWATIMEELNDKADEKFWDVIKEVGEENGFLLKSKGIDNVYDAIKYFEFENWYRVKTASEGAYVLVLTVKSEAKILNVFLKSVFEVMGLFAEIFEGQRRLIVLEREIDGETEIIKEQFD